MPLWEKLLPVLTATGFYIANLLIVIIMSVAVYVHLHPCVPAEILTFGYKSPVSTVMTLLLVVLSMYLQRIISPENI